MRLLTRFAPLLVSILSVNAVYAQQDPTFTRYLFNPLVYNPAVAGYKDHLVLTALHRQQWIGLEGGPNTQIVSADTPLGKAKRVGMGLTLSNDRIGPTQQINADLSYAYRIKIGTEGKLSFGLSAGVLNWRSDWSKLVCYDAADPTFVNSEPISIFSPKFGAGVYYQHPSFYAGFSAPHLVSFDLASKGIKSEYFAKQYRHYLIMAGTQFYFSSDLQFRPNIVLRSVGLFENTTNASKSPTSMDVDASLLFFDKFQAGAAYRFALENAPNNPNVNSDSFSAWFAYSLKENLKFGGSYDFPLNKVGQFGGGSYQITLSYEFFNIVGKMSNPMMIH
jgi:type IX secretion system PorP/SprF family membrane protein